MQTDHHSSHAKVRSRLQQDPPQSNRHPTRGSGADTLRRSTAMRSPANIVSAARGRDNFEHACVRRVVRRPRGASGKNPNALVIYDIPLS